MTARYLVGDVFDQLATLEAGSVDMILTSPPFLALRSYLPADHADKHREIGSEATPGAYIDRLLDWVEACDRVLAPHGSLCVELGDTYAGSGGAGGDYNPDGMRDGQPKFRQKRADGDEGQPRYAPGGGPLNRGGGMVPLNGGPGWPLDKSLCHIPELFRIALAYGFNPLTGRTTPQWRTRNVVQWCRPNPPVGALGDKFRPATSDLLVACHARDRYFDLDAVRQAPSVNTHARTAAGVASRARSGKSADRDGNWASLPELHDTAGAPPLDYWQIPTQPYPGAHYATWPEQLCVIPIKAMAPERVCRTCGQPSRRIVDDAEYVALRQPFRDGQTWGDNRIGMSASKAPAARVANTLGWSDCGHGDNWRRGRVLDPFCGSGTTLAVSERLGRDSIGIDLDARNARLAADRVAAAGTLTTTTPTGVTVTVGQGSLLDGIT